MSSELSVLIIGGGMITNDLILPSIYHLQRTGVVGDVSICALNSGPLKELKNNETIREAFPGQDFTAYPDVSEPEDKMFPDLFKEVLKSLPPRQVVIVAVPDQLHYPMVKEALSCEQHVLCVKPLVLKYEHAKEIEELARERGLFVGVEYHKRFDRRSLIARRDYRLGLFGEFKIGEAKMIEPYFYRYSNFQNWFTVDKTDPFTYVGCHYVDLVYFITGLRPVEVSVKGIRGKFPNGNEGFMWANGRVVYENGAVLSVIDGLGYPDDGAGSNDQCLVMYCEGNDKGSLIKHNDQFRGVTHSYVKPEGCAGSYFNFVNPDFFRLVPWEGEGFKPVGYGFDSIAAITGAIVDIEKKTAGLSGEESLKKRREIIEEVDGRGIIATPANSWFNELVIEAARESIMNDGKAVGIEYGEEPRIVC